MRSETGREKRGRKKKEEEGLVYYCMLLTRFHALLFCGLEVLYFQLLGEKRRVGRGRAAKGAVEAAAAAATPKSPPPLSNCPLPPLPSLFLPRVLHGVYRSVLFFSGRHESPAGPRKGVGGVERG